MDLLADVDDLGNLSHSMADALIERCEIDHQSLARIDAAIEHLEKDSEPNWDVVHVLCWVLKRYQDTWTDKDFGLVPN